MGPSALCSKSIARVFPQFLLHVKGDHHTHSYIQQVNLGPPCGRTAFSDFSFTITECFAATAHPWKLCFHSPPLPVLLLIQKGIRYPFLCLSSDVACMCVIVCPRGLFTSFLEVIELEHPIGMDASFSYLVFGKCSPLSVLLSLCQQITPFPLIISFLLLNSRNLPKSWVTSNQSPRYFIGCWYYFLFLFVVGI